MNHLYALLTTNCNLSCPYCDVKNCDDRWNKELFLEQLEKFDGSIILFGGEPTLYFDRLVDVVISTPKINRKIDSITTNLMKIDDRTLTILQIIGSVGTSWNPTRFTNDEYKTWVNNVDIVAKRLPDIKMRVLVTMTKELLSMPIKKVHDIISSWNSDAIRDIKFEYYVGDYANEEYFAECDEWLCNIYNGWNHDIILANTRDAKQFFYDCTGVYTLNPDGSMHKGCPHISNITIPTKCYTCEKADVCKPCQLQRFCSYPYKFIELVKERENKNENERKS